MTGSPYTLYRRRESGAWYARFRLPNGQWSNPRSTRCYKKREAISWCEEYLRTIGRPARRERITFREFATGFFDPGGLFDRTRTAHKGKVRGGHVRNQQARLKNYLMPTFGDWKLDQIGPGDVDRALLDIHANATPRRTTQGGRLAARTVNAMHADLSQIFAEAVRQGYMPRNPMTEVPRLADTARKRGILTTDELEKLLDPQRATEIWRHPRYWLIFRIAVTTGARSSEIRTLHFTDVRDDHLLFRRSWDDVDGLTPDTKNKEPRTAPLHPTLRRDLVAWAHAVGARETGFLFPSPAVAGRPIDRDAVLKNFRGALDRIGISPDAQERRNLTFHGLRHAAATLAVAQGVNPWLVAKMGGWKSTKVFEGYLDHAEAADWSALETWQTKLLDSGR